MRAIVIFFLLIFLSNAYAGFREEQKRYRRVRAAYREKEHHLKDLFKDRGVAFPPREIFIRAFKLEKSLEIWARSDKKSKFTLIKVYRFCDFSGVLGPKAIQGDGQIPEGFYFIDRFNPASSFYLSLGINYPNRVDRRRSGERPTGGDIFIHGDCVTIGCIPIEDSGIKEVYLLAVEAKNRGQKRIPVHIFPAKFDDSGWENLQRLYGAKKRLINFWESLRPIFSYFQKENKLPEISINRKGAYHIRP